jgi:hypothetical protein
MKTSYAKILVALFAAAALAVSAGEASDRNVTGRVDGTGLLNAGGCPPGPFGDHWVHVQENALVDSYDSRIAIYDPANPGTNSQIGSNCNGAEPDGVSIDNNATVLGDITVATPLSEGDIVITKSTVTGDRNYDAPLWTLNPVIMPDWYTQAGDAGIHGTYGTKTGCYEITNKKFIAYNQAKVSFDPGQYHFDHIELSNLVQFSVGTATQGIVEIFVGSKADNPPYIGTGSIIFENLSDLLPPIEFKGDTTRLRFYYNGITTVDLSNRVEFYGFMYAPNALIEVRNNDDIYGNLVGKQVWLWNNAGVHYDEALAGQDFGSILGPPVNPPKATDWKEVIK